MLEYWGFLPRERPSVLPIVSLEIETLIEGIEEAAIEDFIETFQQFKLMFEK